MGRLRETSSRLQLPWPLPPLGRGFLCPDLGDFFPPRRIPRRSVRTTQVPGGARAGHADLDGASAHLVVQRVHDAHQLLASGSVGVTLRHAQQR